MNTMNANGKQGSLLIISLWILAILSVLALALGHRIALEIHLARQSIAYFADAYTARAALVKSIHILNQKNRERDTLSDPWAHNDQDFKKVSVGLNRFSILSQPEKPVDYGLIDEERKINLNTAPKEVLENLFSEIGLDVDLIPYLMDWIDADDNEMNHGIGAEKNYYETLDSPYSPQNAPLESFAELLLIKDFSKKELHILEQASTIYGSGQINFNTAPPLTWKVLGFSDDFIQKVERFRLGEDGVPYTKDDGAASSLNEFTNALIAQEGLENEERLRLQQFQNYFRPNSTAFKMHARVFSTYKYIKDFIAILSFEQGELKVKYWHEK